MKSHMDLNGWRIDRTARDGWFHLWLKGERFPHAGGPLSHVAKVLHGLSA